MGAPKGLRSNRASLAHKPYEFGCKVSITTTNARSPGGQFVLHAKVLHGRPYDGHTLGAVITEIQDLTGVEIKRGYVDKGYVGHNAPKPLRVYRSGQKRGVHGRIKKELRRRAAIEPVIGHLKSEGHLERNYLKGCAAGAEGRTPTRPMPSSPPQATMSASSADG